MANAQKQVPDPKFLGETELPFVVSIARQTKDTVESISETQNKFEMIRTNLEGKSKWSDTYRESFVKLWKKRYEGKDAGVEALMYMGQYDAELKATVQSLVGEAVTSEMKKVAEIKAKRAESAEMVVVPKMGKTVAEQLKAVTKEQYEDVAFFFKLHYGEVEKFEQAKTGDAPKFMKALAEYDKIIRNSMLTNLFESKETKERASTDKEMSNTLYELVIDSKVFAQMKQLGFVSGKLEGSSHSSWGGKDKETGAAYLNGIYTHSDGSTWMIKYQYQQTGEETIARGELGVYNITKFDEKSKKLWEIKEVDLRVRSATAISAASNGEVNKETLTVIEQMAFNISETALRRGGKTVDGYFGLYNYDARDKLFGWTRQTPSGDSLVRFYGNMNYLELLGRINNKYRYIQGTPEWVAQWITANSAMLSAVPVSGALQPAPQLTTIPGAVGGFAPMNSPEFLRYNVYLKGEKTSATVFYDKKPIEIAGYEFKVVYEEPVGGRNFAYVVLSKGGKEVTDQFNLRTASNEVIKPVEVLINQRNPKTNALETVKAMVLKVEMKELLTLESKDAKYSLKMDYSGNPTQEVSESDVVYLLQLSAGGVAKSLYLKQGQELDMSVGNREYTVKIESIKVSELGGALGRIRDLTVSVSDVTDKTNVKKREINLQVGDAAMRAGGVSIPEFNMTINGERGPDYLQKMPMSALTLASGLAVVNSTKMNESQWLTRTFSQMSGRSMAVAGEAVQFGGGQGQGNVVAAAGFLDLKEKGMQMYALGQDPKELLQNGLAQIGNRKVELGIIRSVPRDSVFNWMGARIGQEERERTEGAMKPGAQVATDYVAKQAAVMSYDSILNEAVTSIGGSRITGNLSGSSMFAMRQALPDSKTFYGLVLQTVSYNQEKIGGAERDEAYDKFKVVVQHQLDLGGVDIKTRYTFEGRNEELFQGKMTPQNTKSTRKDVSNAIDQSLGINSKLNLLSRYTWGGSEADTVSAASRTKQTVGTFTTDQMFRWADIAGIHGANVKIGVNYQRTRKEEEQIATDLLRSKVVDTAYGLSIGPEYLFEWSSGKGSAYFLYQQNVSKTSTESYIKNALASAQTITASKVGEELGGQIDWKNGFGFYGRLRIDENRGTGLDSQQIGLLLAPTYTVPDTIRARANLNLTQFKSGGMGYRDIAGGLMFDIYFGKGGKKSAKEKK